MSFEALLTSLSVQVMLSSISASAKGIANHSVYSGSKGAVEAFARCLAVGESSPHFVPPAYVSFLRSAQTSAARASQSMPLLQVASKRTCTSMLRESTFQTRLP